MNFIRKIVTQSSKGDDKVFYDAMRNLLNFKPNQIENYQKAFTHRSLKKIDKNGEPFNYERLEFVGDAMLGAVIASYLYAKAPNQSEGYLTQMRSKIVSREHLNELGKDLNLISFVKSNIPQNNIGDNIHGNIFEALIGAIYIDRGYIEWCQKKKKKYDINTYEDTGNEPIKHFSVKISIDDVQIAKGRATSKKKAEEQASKRVYYTFQKQIENS